MQPQHDNYNHISTRSTKWCARDALMQSSKQGTGGTGSRQDPTHRFCHVFGAGQVLAGTELLPRLLPDVGCLLRHKEECSGGTEAAAPGGWQRWRRQRCSARHLAGWLPAATPPERDCKPPLHAAPLPLKGPATAGLLAADVCKARVPAVDPTPSLLACCRLPRLSGDRTQRHSPLLCHN